MYKNAIYICFGTFFPANSWPNIAQHRQGIMIEDQVAPKRCGHTKGTTVVPRAEAIARVRAACDARDEGQAGRKMDCKSPQMTVNNKLRGMGIDSL